ncbi:MAG: diguanylate cyclase [Solirubrobacteraceae bacterium]
MSYHWSIHQLTEYLVSVSEPQDPGAAVMVALERAIEALDAELGAVIIDSEVRGSVGFGRQGVPKAFIAAARDRVGVEIPEIGTAHILRARLRHTPNPTSESEAWLVVGRVSEEYAAEEDQMLRGMAIVLGLVLHNLQTLEAERSRHRLVETLLDIQRAISAHRPLNELLDANTAGASSLLGGCPIALLLADPLTPGALTPASVRGWPDFNQATLPAVAQTLAINQNADDCHSSQEQQRLAERVIVAGETAGCLLAQPAQQGARRREQSEMLTAFAQQVSLALTDARALDALREAHHDAITGLPNRRLFLERLEQTRSAALVSGQELTVLFVDLDNFKTVNDTLGHRAGDELLAEVAHRITACIRAHDTAARLGGDEFSVLVDRGGLDVGKMLAGRIIESLGEALTISGREVSVSASVGIASLTPAHENAGALVSDADVAMYRAKRSGRGRWVAFEPRMHDEIINRLKPRTDSHRSHDDRTLTALAQVGIDPPAAELTIAVDDEARAEQASSALVDHTSSGGPHTVWTVR